VVCVLFYSYVSVPIFVCGNVGWGNDGQGKLDAAAHPGGTQNTSRKIESNIGISIINPAFYPRQGFVLSRSKCQGKSTLVWQIDKHLR